MFPRPIDSAHIRESAYIRNAANQPCYQARNNQSASLTLSIACADTLHIKSPHMAVCGRPTFYCSISVSLIVYKAQTWISSLANYLPTHFVNMTDFWVVQPGIEQNECDRYAETVVGSTIRPLSWQGCHSYTVESNDGRTVVQFRAARSPLDENTVKLANKIHPNLVPAMERLDSFDDPSVSVWKMDKIHGLGFMMIMDDSEIMTKLTTTVVDKAK